MTGCLAAHGSTAEDSYEAKQGASSSCQVAHNSTEPCDHCYSTHHLIMKGTHCTVLQEPGLTNGMQLVTRQVNHKKLKTWGVECVCTRACTPPLIGTDSVAAQTTLPLQGCTCSPCFTAKACSQKLCVALLSTAILAGAPATRPGNVNTSYAFMPGDHWRLRFT